MEKNPPQSIDAEMAVLGSMLLDRESISQAVETLDAGYFYKEAHKRIYSAILKLFDENKGVDIVTLTEELRRSGSLDAAGGPAYITAVSSSVPTTANFVHYAKIVKEKALLRNLINTGNCMDSCLDPESRSPTMIMIEHGVYE